jgi:voltage-gated potassium channel
MSDPRDTPEREELDSERWELLARINSGLEKPMIVLGFVWLVLVVVELTAGLSPALERLGYLIWALFAVQFLLELMLAPSKTSYLRGNWITVLALAAPAFRVLAAFRFVRALRAARGLRLLRVVTSLNRGMRSLGRVMGRRGFGYVATLTALVVAGGAAGVYAFERNVPGSVVADFGSALWWTAMVITTMGTDYFPRSAEGRLLCLLLATYGFAVFGYVTAAIASVFVARDAEAEGGNLAAGRQLEQLHQEFVALRREFGETAARLDARRGFADDSPS